MENYIFTRFNLHIGTGTDAKRKYKKDISDFYEYMYKWHDDDTWRVGMHEYYDPGWVKSVGSSQCPESIRKWQFFDREIQWKYVNADITVRCINNVNV